ncbi:hypothetical protein M0802_011441 [Mischocyttarus mexicanus]|nr:hypothetical protein M0802_011441 [Mischocyttarus mexicanus]
MTRFVFLTVILASAVLAFVQAGPLFNIQGIENVLGKLNEPTNGKFENELEETWTDVRNTIDKYFNELLNDPSVSKSFLSTITELTDEINNVNTRIIDNGRDQVDNLVKSNGKGESNIDLSNNDAFEFWSAFQNRMWEQYGKDMENPKVQVIVRKVEDGLKTSRNIVEGVVDKTREQIDAVKSENVELDPKAKEIAEKVTNELEKSKKSLNNFINLVGVNQKEILESFNPLNNPLKSLNWDKAQEQQVEGFKERVRGVLQNLKNNLKEKNRGFWNDPTLNDILDRRDRSVEQIKEARNDVIENLRNEIDSITNEAENLKTNADAASVKDKVQEAWNDFKKKVVKKSEEIKNNPNVKEIIEATDKAIEDAKNDVKKITEAVHKAIESISKETEKLKGNVKTSLKDKVQEAWNDFKKEIIEKSEEIKNNPKVREIVEATDKAIEDAKNDAKKIIDAVHKAIENITKEIGREEVYSNPPSSVKEKVEQVWNDFKKTITNKVEEVIRDPRTKDLLNKSEKWLNEFQENMKNIIGSIRKAADDASDDTNENSAKSAAEVYVRNVKEAWEAFKGKIATTYKNVWDKKRVKSALDDGERVIPKIEESAEDVVRSIRKEVEETKLNDPTHI